MSRAALDRLRGLAIVAGALVALGSGVRLRYPISVPVSSAEPYWRSIGGTRRRGIPGWRQALAASGRDGAPYRAGFSRRDGFGNSARTADRPFPTIDALTAPIVTFARSIATLSLLPLAIVWFGIGESSKIFLIAYACFWVMLSNVIAGREIHRSGSRARRAHDGGFWVRLSSSASCFPPRRRACSPARGSRLASASWSSSAPR